MKNEQRTDSEITANNLKAMIEELYNRYSKKNYEIGLAIKERNQLKSQIVALYSTLQTIAKLDPTVDIGRVIIPEYFKIILKPGGTLAEYIELVLEEYGSLSRSDILDKLESLGVPISKKNARIVLANTINREKDRFRVAEDGKIELIKPAETEE